MLCSGLQELLNFAALALCSTEQSHYRGVLYKTIHLYKSILQRFAPPVQHKSKNNSNMLRPAAVTLRCHLFTRDCSAVLAVILQSCPPRNGVPRTTINLQKQIEFAGLVQCTRGGGGGWWRGEVSPEYVIKYPLAQHESIKVPA